MGSGRDDEGGKEEEGVKGLRVLTDVDEDVHCEHRRSKTDEASCHVQAANLEVMTHKNHKTRKECVIHTYYSTVQ